MAASSPDDGVTALATVAAREAGLVLEGVTITPAGRRRVLRVVVDLPEDVAGGVPMEAVSAASRALAAALEESPVMGSVPYVLEVSSPGVDRPLTEPRHWRRARGRLVRVTVRDGGTVTGRLEGADDAGVVIDGVPVPWDRLGPGHVEVEFGRPDELDDVPDDEAPDDEHDDGNDDEEGRG